MNRIYEGRVSAVFVPTSGKAKKDPVVWVPPGFTPEEYAKVKDERVRLRTLASGNDQGAADAPAGKAPLPVETKKRKAKAK